MRCTNSTLIQQSTLSTGWRETVRPYSGGAMASALNFGCHESNSASQNTRTIWSRMCIRKSLLGQQPLQLDKRRLPEHARSRRLRLSVSTINQNFRWRPLTRECPHFGTPRRTLHRRSDRDAAGSIEVHANEPQAHTGILSRNALRPFPRLRQSHAVWLVGLCRVPRRQPCSTVAFATVNRNR